MKDYKKILEGVVDIINNTEKSDIGFANICTYIGENCPELKESEDEKIRKALIDYFNDFTLPTFEGLEPKKILAWLEKQGDANKEYWRGYWEGKQAILDKYAELEKQGNTNETIKRNEFAQGVLKGAAINLITWIDYNAAEGNMCLSNMECKDIEDALVSGDWDKIYAYIKKKLEKQGEQKPAWSEKDENMLDTIIDASEHHCMLDLNDIDWLKSLKDRIQPKQEWSEEDEKAINDIMWIIEAYRENGFNETHIQMADNSEKWLKSLRPQNKWKPSDEQMITLRHVISGCSYDIEPLVELETKLKEL